jgi:hypothetical protein
LLPVSQGISVRQKTPSSTTTNPLVDLVTIAVALSLNAVSRYHEPIQPDAGALSAIRAAAQCP